MQRLPLARGLISSTGIVWELPVSMVRQAPPQTTAVVTLTRTDLGTLVDTAEFPDGAGLELEGGVCPRRSLCVCVSDLFVTVPKAARGCACVF